MVDIRRIKTQTAIKDALIKLLHDKTFEDISTSEIVQVAEISRSTFYRYYQDKYDIIDKYSEEVSERMQSLYLAYDNQLPCAISAIFEYLGNEEMLERLVSKNGTTEIHKFLRNKLRLMIYNVFQPRYDEIYQENRLPFERDYVADYFSSALFKFLQTWYNRGMKDSPDHISQVLSKFIKAGG